MQHVNEDLTHYGHKKHHETRAHILDHVEVLIAIILEPDSIGGLDIILGWNLNSLIK